MAAAKLVLEHQHKRTIDDDISRLKGLMPWIGGAAIDKLHMATLQPWMADRRGAGCAAGTVNNGLQIVRRILNLAASEWMPEPKRAALIAEAVAAKAEHAAAVATAVAESKPAPKPRVVSAVAALPKAVDPPASMAVERAMREVTRMGPTDLAKFDRRYRAHRAQAA